MALDKNTASYESLAQDVLKKYDRESDTMEYKGFMAKLVSAIAITFSIFQLYTAFFGVLDAQLQRAVHLGFALALSYLLYPTCKSWSRHKLHPLDAILAVLGAASPAYIVIMYRELAFRAGIINSVDLVIGVLGVLLVIEATRRVVGLPMVIVVLAFLTYAFAGPYMPGVLSHRGLTPNQLIGHLYFTTEGIFGIPLGVSSTFIFLFILFGAYLECTGLGKFFIDIANAIAGWASGGPAKVAVISSAFMGTVSGSSVANVAGTGSFTIPMMKKLGYRKEFAGAVEAASSTGGQLMPPVMGAAAFLMAEFVGVPYIEVVEAAIIPAVLYFAGIFIAVHLEAKKLGLRGLKKEELPRFAPLMKQLYLLLPLILLIYLVSTNQKSIQYAAAIAIVAAVAVSLFNKGNRITPKRFLEALAAGGQGTITVAAACGVAGIIAGTITMTGLANMMINTIVALAGNHVIIALFLTMLCCIVLGMGVPTTDNYCIMAATCAPILIRMGVPAVAAHFFVFYFGIVADLTPPVALAAYAGAAIAQANPMKTALTSTKLAIAAFIVPYVFALNPAMLLVDTTIGEVILICITSLVGIFAISAALEGYVFHKMPWFLRLACAAGGLMLIYPGLVTDTAGLLLVGVSLLIQYVGGKSQKTCLAS